MLASVRQTRFSRPSPSFSRPSVRVNQRNYGIITPNSVQVINPATEVLIKEVPVDTTQSAEKKFQEAKKAQQKWKFVSLDTKKKIIANFHQKLFQNKDQLAQTLSSEMGKPVKQALGEINATIGRVKWFLSNAELALAERMVHCSPDWNPTLPNQLQEVIKMDPLGVICNISAWNYPYFVGTNVLVPGILAGNSIVYKPSEHSLLTGLAIGNLLLESGVPEHVLSVIVGGGDIGKELTQKKFDGVFFTGSYETGKRITNSLSNKWARLQLELGGKDPSYVCADANIDHAVASLSDGAFFNTGQSCCSVERIYVDAKVYTHFVTGFVNEVKKFVVGLPTEGSTYIGPLARKEQISILEDQVKDAVAKGAKLLCGGKATKVNGKGFYFEPTVLVDCNSNMKVMRDESFGPIIGIQSVKDTNEAVALMNDTEYGLTAGVYSADQSKATEVLSMLESGTAYWNCCDRVSPNLPWSGRRHSGIGVTLSLDGIRTFAQPRGWHMVSNPQ
eukprot:TRINITY_DN821_c0_g1_i1.p1 TRINITY_DN821_c0_g1~~TRINITY_DN821_c0_g1_i1.p1  ORF type:complete len:519 (+),score=172.00 TRINITY_DN821_c0_g1_i1:51-1559(+)